METFIYKSDNSQTQIQLRRWRDALAINGSTVIILSLWDCLKIFIGIFLGEESVKNLITNALKDYSFANDSDKMMARIAVWVIVAGMLLIVSIIIFLFHYYIGINAYREGRQTAKRKKTGYLVLAFISMLVSGGIIIFNIIHLFNPSGAQDHVGFSTLLLEAVAFLNYLIMIIAAAEIRKLEEARGGTYDNLAEN